MFTLRIHNPVGLLEEEREQTLSALQNSVQLSFRAVLVAWQHSRWGRLALDQQRPQFKMKYSTHLCILLCYEDLCAEMLVLVYLQSCYYFQTPFTLTLRLWDIFILEGEKVLTAMAYTILQLHKSEYIVFTILKWSIFESKNLYTRLPWYKLNPLSTL